METLGQYLKTRREAKKISLEVLSRETRVSLQFLKALERDDWDQFPDPTIARGFIRTYATYLQLELGEVLTRYQTQAASSEGGREEDQREKRKNLFYLKHSRNAAMEGHWVKIAIMVIGIFFAVQYVISSLQVDEKETTSHRERAEVAVPFNPEPPAERVLPESVPVDTEPKPAPQEIKPQKEAILTPSGDGALDLMIEAVEWSWVAVRIDQSPEKEVTLRPGESVRWKAREQFSLDLGNAGGVTVTFDGKRLGSFGPSGAVIKNILLVRE